MCPSRTHIQLVILKITFCQLFFAADALKCHKCYGPDCTDKSKWTGEKECEEDEICQYTTVKNTTSGKIIDMHLGCEEKKNCDRKCTQWGDERQRCYSCCSTDLCNTSSDTGSATSIIQSIVTVAVVSMIGMLMV